MKNRPIPTRFPDIIFFSVLLCVVYFASAQVPQTMSYQAIIRDPSGIVVKEQTVGMKISILKDSDRGTVVYTETHTVTTNSNGLISLEIGNGTLVPGDFAKIDWADGPYFVKTETDPEGRTNYSISGVSPMLSVPYALYAKYAENSRGTQLLPGTQRGNTTYWDGEKWVVNSNYLFNSGQRVGIGTNNPATNLHIAGSLRIEDEIQGVGKVLTNDGGEPDFPFHLETSTSQRGLFVNHTATVGTRYGIWGRSDAISGTGIRADASHLTGVTYGLWATSESTSGSAVFASANATSGSNYGVQSYSSSSSGRGVYGYATSFSGTNYGVYGRTNSASGYAGYFQGGRNYFQGKIGINTLNPDTQIHITDGNEDLKISGTSIVKEGPKDFSLISDMSMIFDAGKDFDLKSGSDMSLNSSFNMKLSSSAEVSISGIQTTISSTSITSISGTSVLFDGPVIMNTDLGVALSVVGTAAKPGGGSWSVLSDRQLKTEIEDLGPGVLNKLLTLKGYTYKYTDSALETNMVLPGRQTGLIAQEVQQVFPDWVDTNDDGYLFVTERGLTAIIVEAMRELREEKDAEIDELQQRLERMEVILQSIVESDRSVISTKHDGVTPK